MTRVLLDACIPHYLRRELAEFAVETAQYAGLAEIKDSDLIDLIDGTYDVLVTLDGSLVRQQRIGGRRIAIIVLEMPNQQRQTFMDVAPNLKAAIRFAQPGSVHVIAP